MKQTDGEDVRDINSARVLKKENKPSLLTLEYEVLVRLDGIARRLRNGEFLTGDAVRAELSSFRMNGIIDGQMGVTDSSVGFLQDEIKFWIKILDRIDLEGTAIRNTRDVFRAASRIEELSYKIPHGDVAVLVDGFRERYKLYATIGLFTDEQLDEMKRRSYIAESKKLLTQIRSHTGSKKSLAMAKENLKNYMAKRNITLEEIGGLEGEI